MKGIYKVSKIGVACVFRSKTVGMLLTSEILQISIDTMYYCELNIVDGSVPGVMRREVSHSIIGGPAPALGTHPVDVLAHILHTVEQYYYSSTTADRGGRGVGYKPIKSHGGTVLLFPLPQGPGAR